MRIVSEIAITLCSVGLFTLWHATRVVVRLVRDAAAECGETCSLPWGWLIFSASSAVGVIVVLAGMVPSEASVMRILKTASRSLRWNTVRIASEIAITLCSVVLFTLWHVTRVAVPIVRGAAASCGETCCLLRGWLVSAGSAVVFVVVLAGMLSSVASVMRAIKTAAKLGA